MAELVREEIVGPEASTWLGQAGEKRPEFLVLEARGDVVCRTGDDLENQREGGDRDSAEASVP
jgi:hypothetical protein